MVERLDSQWVGMKAASMVSTTVVRMASPLVAGMAHQRAVKWAGRLELQVVAYSVE